MKDNVRKVVWLIITPIMLTACIALYICGLLGVFEPERSGGNTVKIVEEETADAETIAEETVAVTTMETTMATEATTEAVTEPETTASAEELAKWVIDTGLNGNARKEALGDRYEEVQKWIDENYTPPVKAVNPDNYSGSGYSYPDGGDVLTPSAGVAYFNGHMETYYNLDMSGVIDIMRSLGYSGDYWVRADGCKMFGDYIMVAADFGWLPRGSVVLTSLGWGIVCDTGAGGSNWLDIATTW